MARKIAPARKLLLNKLREHEVPSALLVGAQATIVARGLPDDETSAEVIGYFMYLEFPNGKVAGLILRWRDEAKFFKTTDGVISQYQMFHPNDRNLTLPLLPQMRSEEEFWAFISKKNESLQT